MFFPSFVYLDELNEFNCSQVNISEGHLKTFESLPFGSASIT